MEKRVRNIAFIQPIQYLGQGIGPVSQEKANEELRFGCPQGIPSGQKVLLKEIREFRDVLASKVVFCWTSPTVSRPFLLLHCVLSFPSYSMGKESGASAGCEAVGI